MPFYQWFKWVVNVNKKILIFAVALCLFIGLAIAGTQNGYDDSGRKKYSPDLSVDEKNYLSSKGFDDFNISEAECEGDYCKVHLFKQDVINKDILFNKTYCWMYKVITKDRNYFETDCNVFTDVELEEQRNLAIDSMLKQIHDAYKGRDNKQSENKLEKGVIDLK